MEVYELCEAPENMAFYVHGQGHAIEHDSRQLIVGLRSRLSAAAFPLLLAWSSSWLDKLKRLVVWGQYGWMDKHLKPANDRSGTIARLVPEGSPARLS